MVDEQAPPAPIGARDCAPCYTVKELYSDFVYLDNIFVLNGVCYAENLPASYDERFIKSFHVVPIKSGSFVYMLIYLRLYYCSKLHQRCWCLCCTTWHRGQGVPCDEAHTLDIYPVF